MNLTLAQSIIESGKQIADVGTLPPETRDWLHAEIEAGRVQRYSGFSGGWSKPLTCYRATDAVNEINARWAEMGVA